MSLSRIQILLLVSSFLAGLVVGFAVFYLVPFLRAPGQDQLSSVYYQQLQIVTSTLRGYAYLNMLYNFKDVFIYTANARILITLANITGSVEMLNLAKTNLETAINTTSRIDRDIDLLQALNITQIERNILNQVRNENANIKIDLQTLLNAVSTSINNKSIDPSLPDKAQNILNNVAQRIDRVSTLISSITSS
ncbi:MAG: hypothetical protein ABWJ42_01935 [Sulfolobales archaeon]